MQTKFQVGQELKILSEPGWTGTVVLIDIYEKKYLLDCHPGAMSYYTWYATEKGLLAGNWVHEDDLALQSD